MSGGPAESAFLPPQYANISPRRKYAVSLFPGMPVAKVGAAQMSKAIPPILVQSVIGG
jgi:hypothetical protein